MNKRQVKGTAKELAGKVERRAAKFANDDKRELRGMAREAAGKAERAAGDLEARVKKARPSQRRARS